MRLSALRALWDVPGVRFFSLQRGVLEEAEGQPFEDRLAQDGDFAVTASVVAELDLVIAVDTAVAHLAGALGRPLWLLLPKIADWRWLVDREDSPWYPTARLFRQETEGEWKPVVERVAAELAALVRFKELSTL